MRTERVCRSKTALKKPTSSTKAATVGTNWGSWRGRGASLDTPGRHSVQCRESHRADQPRVWGWFPLVIHPTAALGLDLVEGLEWR